MNRPFPGERAYPCPKCQAPLRVADSRPTHYAGESAVRRRRVCDACDHRFTTYEISEDNLGNRLALLERILADRDAIIATITLALASIRGKLE